MAQEDETQRPGTNIGRSSGTKPKEKKVPRRGLGVAQLEKIRLEEQQKKVANYRHSNQSSSSSSSSSSIPFFSLSNNVDARKPDSEIPGDFNVPKLWNNSCDHLNLPQEFNPVWPIPSVVNVPTPQSSQPSISSFQMELPLNQNYHGNYQLICPEEEIKILGNKRRYAFVDIDQPGPSFNSKFLTSADPTRLDGLASSKNGVTFNPEHRNSNLSELGPPSCSISIPEPNLTKNITESSALDANFLTLSLQTPTTWTSSSSKFNPNYETIPFQGIVNETIFQPQQSGSSQHMPFYTFFPPAKKHNHESASTTRHCSTGGAEGNVDLNLKL